MTAFCLPITTGLDFGTTEDGRTYFVVRGFGAGIIIYLDAGEVGLLHELVLFVVERIKEGK